MRIQTHGNNLIQLSMSYFPCNCYLVREADGFTLVDTAIWSAKGILAAAQQFGSDGSTIRQTLMSDPQATRETGKEASEP